MSDLQAIKGFKDLLPGEASQWRVIEAAAREVLDAHGYREIRPPVLEYTALFSRSIGQSTDIVEKEMFTFEDRGGHSISLRPEGTAGVVRAYIEHGLFKSNPKSKLYYIGPMFRRERPQKGRLRQFHQIGAEAFGIPGALVDAELIMIETMIFERLGVRDLDLVINSLGCRNCRPAYREKLVNYLKSLPAEMFCTDCQRRRETNPMRVLDCKNEGCRAAVEKAPDIFNDLCNDCREHHSKLKNYLRISGLEAYNFKHIFNVKFETNWRLMRGLDYYTRTAFEFLSPNLGAQSAVAAGGRYDNLVEELGGPPTPGVGFAIGIERLMLLIPEATHEKHPDIFLIFIEGGWNFALVLSKGLSDRGISIEMGHDVTRGLKGQMKQANNSGAKFALILGPRELETGYAILQNMEPGVKEPPMPIEITPDLIDMVENIRGKVEDKKKKSQR